jgi:H2-forming N5,N10-methylenetetrahydromethanopterin dehydrogenase-like enzyme
VPLALRGLLYLKVEVGMKKMYRIMIDCGDESEEIDRITEEDIEKMDGFWLDTGDIVIQLPQELIPYLNDGDILGIA